MRRVGTTRGNRTKSLSVDLIMSPQMVGTRRAIVTELAFVGSFLRMSALVTLQMRRAISLIVATGIGTVIHAVTVRGQII